MGLVHCLWCVSVSFHVQDKICLGVVLTNSGISTGVVYLLEYCDFNFVIMANVSNSNGETGKKESRVNFNIGAATEADHVEVSINQGSKTHKKKQHGYHFLPKPFERSNGSLFNPRFDSEILENFLIECYFPQARRLFRCIVYYVAIASACWALFFGLIQFSYRTDHWRYFIGGSVILFIVMVVLLMFTYTVAFKQYYKIVGFFLAVILVIVVQLPFVFHDPDISPVGTFCGVVEILILLYSFLPLNLYFSAGLGALLSASSEVLTALRFPQMCAVDYIICKLLLHLIIHLIGIFIYIMSNTRVRSNFSKIGQSVLAQRDLMIEKEIKEKMIHSLMPPVVANSVMATHPSKDGGSEEDEDGDPEKKKRRKSKHVKGEIIFRKFQMDEMKNVSILYADIVGFTKMSSNKTAERLVGLLNDLFGRFDKLCNAAACEKISTLGDCYYCVSGCPNPCPDHAKCCVEMGLSMVIAIRAFDEDHSEEVSRVLASLPSRGPF